MVQTQQDQHLSSILSLHESTDANLLIRSNRAVVEYYQPQMDMRERCHDFVKGEQWTDEEREVARQKKKALIEFNKLKTSERTFVGSMIQQRYDIKPAPREPTDQDKSDVYTAMYHWQADTADVRYKDPGLVRDAWAGGNGWQESYVEITPGRKPRIHVENQNPFACYPDPNRRDLVNNWDMEFFDRLSWLSKDHLIDALPDMEEKLRDGLQNFTSINYLADKVHADRMHEWQNVRNGKFLTIERFYRVRKKMWFGINQGNRIDLGHDVPPTSSDPNVYSRDQFKQDYPDHTLHYEREEFLYLAIACPAFGAEFLYNGEYHCQPRDPVTQRIMFPFIELVDEDLDGSVSGHVQPQLGPIQTLNSLMVNKLYQAKNAAGQSHVISQDHFDADTIADISETMSDGARTYPKIKSAPAGSGIDLVPQGTFSQDGSQAIDFVAQFADEVSSTPPSMKGLSEGNVPGVLNEQRIQQSFIQSQGFTNNFMGFLTRRAKLWKYYWKEYFVAEDVIRILEKKDDNDPDWIAVNKIVMDEFGNPQKKNSLDDGDAYDITFEDSWRSPTVRDKVRQQITQLMTQGVAQNDPALGSILSYYFLSLSDAPQELKNMVKQHNDQQQQAQEAQANAPAKAEPDPIHVSLALKSEDLHDPATIAMLQFSNAIPQEAADQMRAAPVPTPKPEAKVALHGQHLDNMKKIQDMRQAAIPPSPVRPGPDAVPSSAPRQQPSMAGA